VLRHGAIDRQRDVELIGCLGAAGKRKYLAYRVALAGAGTASGKRR
jgi:hypothetical protein